MKWGYSVPVKGKNEAALTISFEINDSITETLMKDQTPEATIQKMVEFEYFLMSASRYKMAVLDEQTISYLIVNYDSQKERIIDTFKGLAKAIAESYKNDSPTTNNGKDQSGTLTETDPSVRIPGTST